MLVPRSFSYSSRSSSRTAPRNERCAVSVPASKAQTSTRKVKKEGSERPGTMARMSTSPPSIPSKPVIIPHRTNSSGSSGTQKYQDRDSTTNKTPRRASNVAHDPNSVPPAVAALLAVTSIPTRPRYGKISHQRSSQGRSPNSLDSVVEWTNLVESDLAQSPPFNSSLDALLSRSDIPATYAGESVSSEGTIEPSLSVRSTSSVSVPSLDTDDESSASLSSPPTPGWHTKRSVMDRRGKRLASPPTEDCALDHPLLSMKPGSKLDKSDDDAAQPEALVPINRNISGRRASSLKSNLTSSLRAITSAARSFSNMTSVVIPPDDLLTRSISIRPRDTDERRPVLGEEAPTPALRRYLNPSTNSAAEARLRNHDFRTPAENDKCTAMIQMQTYQRNTKTPRKRPQSVNKSKPMGSVEGSLSETGSIFRPLTRQREVRENSDFLRVVVLELNMKRVGKLKVEALGHARICLPPRLPGRKYSIEENGVPSRWVGEVNMA